MSKVPCGGFKLDNNFLGINENNKLSLVGGSDSTPYQQLVTDGTGNAKWEDRLCYTSVGLQQIGNDTVKDTDNSGLESGS